MNHLIGVLGSYLTSTPAPTNVRMSTYTAGDTSISVSWDAVSGATSYTVKFYSNTSATTSGGTLVETNANTDVSTTSRSSTFTLVANTYYYASVTTINYGGTSSEQVSSSTIQTAAAGLTGTVTTFAGSGTAAFADGTGTNASFSNLMGMAFATDGTIYVADYNNNRIRKITTSAVVSTFAGSGSASFAEGIGTNASFFRANGLAFATDGTLYFSAQGNNRICKITTGGVVSSFAGSGSASFADGIGTNASFSNPMGLAIATDGTIYVSDYSNNRIRKITTGGLVSTFAGNGTVAFADGTGTNASFFRPHGLAIATDGTVYVADYSNYRIRKITTDGVVSTFAGSGTAGSADGIGTNASFRGPMGVAVATDGTVYVADNVDNRIRKITTGGLVSTLAGSGTAGSADGTGTNASFRNPSRVSVATDGTIYVADYNNYRIRKIT